MRIRFIKSWRQYKEGQEVDWKDGVANYLVDRARVAERVEVELSPGGQTHAMVPPTVVELVQTVAGTARKFGRRREV